MNQLGHSQEKEEAKVAEQASGPPLEKELEDTARRLPLNMM